MQKVERNGPAKQAQSEPRSNCYHPQYLADRLPTSRPCDHENILLDHPPFNGSGSLLDAPVPAPG